MYIYIYIYREKERERYIHTYVYTYIYIYIHMCVYIYVYKHVLELLTGKRLGTSWAQYRLAGADCRCEHDTAGMRNSL